MDVIVLARVLHALGIIVWIGGVAMTTAVILPAVRSQRLGRDRLEAFEAIERCFAWYAKAAVVIVGVTGIYMVAELGLWERFEQAEFWWMHAMVCVWLLFAVVLFVAEPLVLHRYFHRWATVAPDTAFARLQLAHWIALALSVVTVFGAVAGSHGWSVF